MKDKSNLGKVALASAVGVIVLELKGLVFVLAMQHCKLL